MIALLASFALVWVVGAAHDFFACVSHDPHGPGDEVNSTETHPIGHDRVACGLCDWIQGPRIAQAAVASVLAPVASLPARAEPRQARAPSGEPLLPSSRAPPDRS